MNQKTIDLLKANPHYKPSPGQLIPDGYVAKEEPKTNEPIRTFGVPPAMHTIIPKQQTSPKVRINKKKKGIDK